MPKYKTLQRSNCVQDVYPLTFAILASSLFLAFSRDWKLWRALS